MFCLHKKSEKVGKIDKMIELSFGKACLSGVILYIENY